MLMVSMLMLKIIFVFIKTHFLYEFQFESDDKM